MTTTVFSFSVSFSPFRSLAVLSLGFTLSFEFSFNAAFITAIGLSPPARPTNTEKKTTPATLNPD
jgi:hypothetical protein